MVLSCAVTFLTLHAGPENAVEAYKKLLRERGEKLEIGELQPAPVPSDQNCVSAVQTAFSSFSSGYQVPDVMQMVAPAKAMIAWQQPKVRGYDGSDKMTNSWEDFGEDVAAHRQAIDELKEVFDRPKLDFALDYKKNYILPLPHLALLKRAAQVIEAATVLDLHNGDDGAVATNICVLLALVRADHDEPILISHLVRIAMVAIAENPTWELLQSTNATDAQLALLQKNWTLLEFLDSLERTVEMERAFIKDDVEKARADSEAFDLMMKEGGSSSSSSGGSGWALDFDALGEDIKYNTGKTLWRASWSYTEEIHFLQGDQIMLETFRAMETNSQFLKPQYDAMQLKVSSLGLTNAGAALFRALKIPDFGDLLGGNWMGGAINKTIRIEAARRIVVTAIALKRFQLKHRQWPHTLAELAPEFFPSVPIDPYDGKPLRYHANPDGTYLLYCVGEDGVDDGGNPTNTAASSSSPSASLYWQNNRARDWVWPQPATEAEIKYFYEHPVK